jgi:ABC-type uncharacterized transport system YnjBCD permease subunit
LTLPGLELQPLRRPARSQSLLTLRCLGSRILMLVYHYYFFYTKSEDLTLLRNDHIALGLHGTIYHTLEPLGRTLNLKHTYVS